ncbi:helix-turn-helix domain-containing protein [Kribbella sp. NBC_01505]|uniref:ArsR/SmtB family transcription factor n=1 Tax=Kribbella sp. NBC_01505 TaxID=2903580 RepID=UPI0038639266
MDDEVFRALADPSRRQLLDALNAQDGQTLRELCAGLSMARQSVSKHLAVLEAETMSDNDFVHTTMAGPGQVGPRDDLRGLAGAARRPQVLRRDLPGTRELITGVCGGVVAVRRLLRIREVWRPRR